MKNRFGADLPGQLAAGVALWAILAPGHPAVASPLPEGIGEAPEPVLLACPPTGSSFLGYRWFSREGSLQAAPYLHPGSSVTFGFDLLACPLPYRYHLHAEYLSAYDYYADGGFAYQDLVLFRNILVGVHHNLPHLDYQFPGEPPTLVYSDGDPGEQYALDFVRNNLVLRLKAPDFPLHAFWQHSHLRRDGIVQERFLLGDYANLHLVSRSRDISWRADDQKLGLNSHLGPVEVEYAYLWSRFDPGRDSVLLNPYPASIIFDRPADLYPHSVVAGSEAMGHTLKLHSSYTGGLVAGATLGTLREKNHYSSAEAVTRKGGLDLSWIPRPTVGVFFRYRHRTLEMETPQIVTLTGLSQTLQYPVRRSISHHRDLFSLTGRYRPFRLLTLITIYEFTHLSRKDLEEWPRLPGHTNLHRLNLAAQFNPLTNLKTRAVYEYRDYRQPGYNTTPDHANSLRLASTYAPVSWFNFHLEYFLAVTKRNGLRYADLDLALLEGTERSGRRDQLLASLSAALSAKTTVTASWYYQRRKVEQDLAFKRLGLGEPLAALDFAVPYQDDAHSYSLALHHLPREDISVSADVTCTRSRGATGYHELAVGAPFALGSFSDLKTSEVLYSLDLRKKLPRKWEIGLRSSLGIHDDRLYDFLDGEVFTVMLRLKRYFRE